MKRILFITGTDTNIGKTSFGVLLLKILRREGVNALLWHALLCPARRAQ